MNIYRFSPNSTSTPITPQGHSKTSMVAIAHTFYYFPHTGAQLQIDDATITYHYKSYIRNAAYGPPLLNYIQQRNQWTPAIMHTIDWDAHGMAIR
jgi:hypothetical protein